MIDLDELVGQCVSAVADREPQLAVRDVLRRAMSRPGVLVEALGEPSPGLDILHRSDDVTVIRVVWPPHMSLFPHDHRMWAAIGIYGGQEDNSFYRRQDGTLALSGGKELREGDVLLLGDDAIHAVRNPARRYTGAIHVYGGDFVAMPRSQWQPDTLREEPYDMDTVVREFARADEEFRSSNA